MYEALLRRRPVNIKRCDRNRQIHNRVRHLCKKNKNKTKPTDNQQKTSQMIIQPRQEPRNGSSDTNLVYETQHLIKEAFSNHWGKWVFKNQLEKVKLVPNLIPYTTRRLNNQRFKSKQ